MTTDFPPLLAAWLRRAAQHRMQYRLLLSGSALIAAICPQARRPNDIDYAVRGLFNPESMAEAAREIVAISDPGSTLRLISIEPIFEYSNAFPGLRVILAGAIGDADEQQFLVDFAFGDPLSLKPRSVVIERVGPVRAVAPETLFAWKLHTIVQFWASWRPKDIYDLWVLWEQAELDLLTLPAAIELAFSSRGDEIGLLHEFRTDAAWGLEGDGPEEWASFAAAYGITRSFHHVRAAVRTALDQLLGPSLPPSSLPF